MHPSIRTTALHAALKKDAALKNIQLFKIFSPKKNSALKINSAL